MFRNLVTALVLKDRVTTTLPKAKELKRLADKLVTLGKRNTAHARAQAMEVLQPINRSATGNAHKLTAMHRLFSEISPRYKTREGGYTRVVKSGVRLGDRAPMAIVEFVEAEAKQKEPAKRERKTSRARKTAAVEAA